jgi:hypothetical protein
MVIMDPKAHFNSVLEDLQMALHCHGCGTFLPFETRCTHGEFCSESCWIASCRIRVPCALQTTLGFCHLCSDYTFQPFVPHVQQLRNTGKSAQNLRTIRALDAFLFEHDSLPQKEQYMFRMNEHTLFGANHEAFVEKWYWNYTFGLPPRTGTLPAHWLSYSKFMPLERRASDEFWPFYDSVYC